MTTRRIKQQWVDPRSRGGDRILSHTICAIAGRSPLTRGRRKIYRDMEKELWSIPAHAGET